MSALQKCLILTLMIAAASPAQAVSRFALVVTNNRSQNEARPDLQYADDDGAKYAELFAEELGIENVQLLTDFDAPSQRLYPDWQGRAVSPTRVNVDAAIGRVAEDIARARARGEEAEIYVVFAGHGDIDRGRGFVELADGRLTSRDLDERVLAKLAPSRVHLILDSCNSYFMLNPRKPGGKRWQAREQTASLLDKYPNLGAVVATSAEAVTYEWSELQSGIFSYELRSGLRGAADVDGDGSVSYAELASFIEVANAGVTNDLYRPKVFARAPARAQKQALFVRHSAARVLTLDATAKRRLTLRDAQGVRVLDVHQEAGTALSLHVPKQSIGIYEQVSEGERPTVVYREYAAGAPSTQPMALLARSQPSMGGRGEAPVFASLFASPFGREALLAVEETHKAQSNEVHYGVSMRDAEVLALHLRAAFDLERNSSDVTAMVASLTLMALGVTQVDKAFKNGRKIDTFEKKLALVTGVGLPAFAAGTLLVDGLAHGPDLPSPWDPSTKVYQDAMANEELRTEFVLELREKFRERAERDRKRRKAGWGFAALGLAFAGAGAVGALSEERDMSGYAAMAGGVLVGVVGLRLALWSRTPCERMWELYQANESGATADPEPESAVTLTPTIGYNRGMTTLGFGMTF